LLVAIINKATQTSLLVMW